MSTEPVIPPLRDLPPGRLVDRKQHLLGEIARRPGLRLKLPSLSSWFSLSPHVRVFALAGLGACLAVAAAALSFAMIGGSQSRQIAFVAYTTDGANWRLANKSISLAYSAPPSAPSVSSTRIVGGKPSQRALLRAILNGMRGRPSRRFG